MSKTYNSFEEFKKDMFPKAYEKELKEKRIKELGVWKVLEEELLEVLFGKNKS